MKPKQAIEILNNATQPQNIGRIDRNGYVMIEEALFVLQGLIPKDEEPENKEAK